MGRGRPAKSKIRERMQSIVDALGVTYGYEIHQVYEKTYGPVDLRSMYYHLSKGTDLGEFEEVGIEKAKGAYTWGDESTRKYYILGPKAKKEASEEVLGVVESMDIKKRKPKNFVEWEDVAKKYAEQLREAVSNLDLEDNNLDDVLGDINNVLDWLEGEEIEEVREIKKLKNEAKKNTP